MVLVDTDYYLLTKGQTINVYKLFDLTVSGNEPDKKYAYTVNEKYKAILKKLLNLGDMATDKDYYDGVNGKKDTIQGFANDFTKELLTSTDPIDPDATSSKITEEKTEHTFNDLEFGYYLVYQTGTKSLQSSLVSVDKETGAEVDLKGEAPSIEKTANAETVEIGQVVTYTITGTIPDTTGYDSYVYKIKDTLTTGLDFVKNAQGTAQEGTNYTVSVQIKNGASSTPTATLSGSNNRTMTLDLSQWIRNNQASKGQKFTVTYYAKVNKDAVVETENSAELEYGNDQDNTTITTPSEAKTPTYPLQIHKLETGKTDEYLAGATFRLYRNKTDATNKQNPIAVTGSVGSYTVDPVQTGDNKLYDMVSVGNELTDHASMNLRLNGLKEGTYYLMETQAPEGYNGVTTPIKITITKSTTENVGEWTITKGDGQAENDQIIDIENTTGTILPGTGGMGTILFTVIGVALVLIVAASFVISRRKRAE